MLAIRLYRESQHTNDSSVSLLRFFNRIGVDFLHRYRGDLRIAFEGSFGAIEFGLIGVALTVAHSEGVVGQLVGVHLDVIGSLIFSWLPLTRNLVRRLG